MLYNTTINLKTSKSLSYRKFRWAFQGILLIAALLLFLFLDVKPPQHDEGVNGWFSDDLVYKGYYAYTPEAYHGPLHYYLLFFFKLLLGRNLWALRLSAVLFSLGSIYLLLHMKRYLGRFSAYVGALLTAVSPGIIFYSRYAIHESGLLFFSILSLLAFFRMRMLGDRISLWLMGAGITGMIVTKETYVITIGCFAAAFLILRIYEKFLPSPRNPPPFKVHFRPADIVQTTSVCLFVIILLYSGFFLNWNGIIAIGNCFVECAKIGISRDQGQS